LRAEKADGDATIGRACTLSGNHVPGWAEDAGTKGQPTLHERCTVVGRRQLSYIPSVKEEAPCRRKRLYSEVRKHEEKKTRESCNAFEQPLKGRAGTRRSKRCHAGKDEGAIDGERGPRIAVKNKGNEFRRGAEPVAEWSHDLEVTGGFRVKVTDFVG